MLDRLVRRRFSLGETYRIRTIILGFVIGLFIQSRGSEMGEEVYRDIILDRVAL